MEQKGKATGPIAAVRLCGQMRGLCAWRGPLIVGLMLLLLGIVSHTVYFRLDLTADKRFTLAPATQQMLDSLPATVHVKSYLGGELPLEFTRLRNALQELLEEYRVASGQRIVFSHEDPNATEDTRERAYYHEHLIREGITPINTQERAADGSVVERLLFPAISVSYRGRVAHASIYSEDVTLPVPDNIDRAMQSAEHTITSTIARLLRAQRDRVVLLEGRGSASGGALTSLERILQRDFDVERLPLASEVGAWAQYRIAILVGPTEPVAEAEKLALDQYIMGGGRLLLAMTPVLVGLDTLQQGQQTLAYATDQNLGDLLFRWGMRIPPVLVQDLQCALIPINTALSGQAARFTPSMWPYFPLLTPNPTHPATRNVNLVYSRFPSHVELLGKADTTRRMHVLLATSPYARTLVTPKFVDLAEVQQPPRPELMTQGPLAVAVAREGAFTSLYQHRPLRTIAPGQQFQFVPQSPTTRVAVVSAPSILINEVRQRGGQSQVLPLGFDRYTQQTFGNGEFISNLAHYLAGYDDLLSLRNRELSVRILNQQACAQQRAWWQWGGLLGPACLFMGMGLVWHLVRRHRYTRRPAKG